MHVSGRSKAVDKAVSVASPFDGAGLSSDLIGLPWQIIVGPRGMKNGVVEVKERATGERTEMTPEAALAKLTAAAGG